MISTKAAFVEEFAIHRLGTDLQECVFSDYTAVLRGDEEQGFLRKLFLKPFTAVAETAEFTHPVGLEYNVLHGLCAEVQAGKDLVGCSRSIARHLFDVSRHHGIRSGDLFVARFSGVELGGELFQAVGIYKFDDKEVFLESRAADGNIGMQLCRGLGNSKPNKAVLVVFTLGGPTLLILDDGPYTEYWQKDFIGQQPRQDHVNSTRNVLEMTRNFITEQLPQDKAVERADQIDLLNRSVQYFKANTEFNKEAFAQEVFQEEAVIESFDRYGQQFKNERGVQFNDIFDISAPAVRKQARVFKSVLKLDRNFHIYIHGDRSLIEHGVDEKGRKYYKIFYQEES